MVSSYNCCSVIVYVFIFSSEDMNWFICAECFEPVSEWKRIQNNEIDLHSYENVLRNNEIVLHSYENVLRNNEIDLHSYENVLS